MRLLLRGLCLLPQAVCGGMQAACCSASLTLLSLEQLLPPGQRMLPHAVHHWLGAGCYGIMVPVTPEQLRRHSHLPSRPPMKAYAESKAQHLSSSASGLR